MPNSQPSSIEAARRAQRLGTGRAISAARCPRRFAELAVLEHVARPFDGQPQALREVEQHIVRAGIAALAVVGREQRVLQCAPAAYRPFLTRPVAQSMGVERVPDVRARTKSEAFGGATLDDPRIPYRVGDKLCAPHD